MLDTWFSSALWPVATLGWPTETPELARYYPGDVNVTAREIIRLWENRMIFTGLFLRGDVPFTDVIITATVLAVDGRRMSKSLGTGIDPLEAVDRHGADATRYGLLKMSSTQDVRFSWGAIEEGQRLANKLWNVVAPDAAARQDAAPERRPEALEERWILGRIVDTRGELERLLPSFEFARVVELLYHLVFDDFCDWYAEAIKPRLYAGDEAAIATALAALEELLVLLHPVMPHVTEEIWSQFHETRLIVTPWPEPDACPVRRPATRSTGCRRPRHLPALGRAAAARRRGEADLRRRREARAGQGRRATSRPSAAACGRRSRAPRGCSRTSASSRTRRPPWSRPSATSSSGTAAS